MPKVIRNSTAAAKRRQDTTLHSLFGTQKRKGRPSAASASHPPTSQSPPSESSSSAVVAEQLAARLKTRPVYLTPDRASWYLHVQAMDAVDAVTIFRGMAFTPVAAARFEAVWKDRVRESVVRTVGRLVSLQWCHQRGAAHGGEQPHGAAVAGTSQPSHRGTTP